MDGYLTDTQLRTAITAVGTHRATAGLPRLRSSPARAVCMVLGLPPTRKFMLKLKTMCPGGRVDFDAVSCRVRVRAAVLSTPTLAMWQPTVHCGSRGEARFRSIAHGRHRRVVQRCCRHGREVWSPPRLLRCAVLTLLRVAETARQSLQI